MENIKLYEDDLAKSFGFECLPDNHRGWGYHSFAKGEVRVWLCRKGWARARIIDNRFTGHKYFDTLDKALSYSDCNDES
jgi:hypothetical protein